MPIGAYFILQILAGVRGSLLLDHHIHHHVLEFAGSLPRFYGNWCPSPICVFHFVSCSVKKKCLMPFHSVYEDIYSHVLFCFLSNK